MLSRPAPLLLLVLLQACGGGDEADGGADSAPVSDGGSDTGPAPMDASTDAEGGLDSSVVPDASVEPIAEVDLAARLAPLYCAAQRSCCERTSTVPDDCVPALQADLERILGEAGDAMAYDADAAGRCVAALEALPRGCDDAIAAADTLAACTFVLDGVVEPGGACDLPTDCARPPGSSSTGCLEYGGVAGMRCRAFLQTSMNGAACSFSGSGSETTATLCVGADVHCAMGTCVTSPGTGESCPDATCRSEAYCAPSGTCRARVGEGESCAVDPCALPFDCTDDVCTPRLPLMPLLCLHFSCIDRSIACAP